MSEQSSSDTDHCPNCGSVGDVHYDGVANNLDVEEWDCYNENCRVSLYYVQPGGDRAVPSDDSEREDEPLPFKCEYEIGVQEAGHPDEWEHYHPKAKTEKRAREKAHKEAKRDGMTDPIVFMSTGPYKPRDPIRVGGEMIEEVFGDVQ